MTLFVALFSVFNLVLAAATAGRASRLLAPESADEWASARLLSFTRGALFLIPAAALLATGFAWAALSGAEPHWAAPIVLSPLALLIVLGALFACIDVIEDGVLDFGRGSRKG